MIWVLNLLGIGDFCTFWKLVCHYLFCFISIYLNAFIFSVRHYGQVGYISTVRCVDFLKDFVSFSVQSCKSGMAV